MFTKKCLLTIASLFIKITPCKEKITFFNIDFDADSRFILV